MKLDRAIGTETDGSDSLLGLIALWSSKSYPGIRQTTSPPDRYYQNAGNKKSLFSIIIKIIFIQVRISVTILIFVFVLVLVFRFHVIFIEPFCLLL